MRSTLPSERVLRFWMRVVERCQERGVWCEDFSGVNLTVRSLMRASLADSATACAAGSLPLSRAGIFSPWGGES